MKRMCALVSIIGWATTGCVATLDGTDPELELEPEIVLQPIINGTTSPVAQNGVIMVQLPNGGRCSGSLIGPSLVLTARHCVSDTDETLVCGPNGPISGARVFRDFAPSQILIYAGNQRATLRARARGRQLVTTGAKTLCSQDIAFITLDRPISDITPLKVRALGPSIGERITSVGWGVTTTSSFPAARQQRANVTILDVGPTRSTPSNSFTVGESICSGDSGGPALASDGTIIGVVSYGGNGRSSPTDPSVGCRGTASRNTYVSVAPFASLLRTAQSAAARPIS